MDLYKTFGIYEIRNTISDFSYIGQTTVSFGDRRDCHYALLRSGKHHNSKLQEDWNIYGENCFEFSVLRVVDNIYDVNIDQLEMDAISENKKRGLSYNIDMGGKSGALGRKMSDKTKSIIGAKNRENMTGRIASSDTKEKMSASQSRRYASWTDEDRLQWGEKMSKVSGYKWDDEARKRFSDKQSTSPNGAKYTVEMVRLIRKMYEQDGKSCADIAKILGMHKHTVYLIATYRRWKNV